MGSEYGFYDINEISWEETGQSEQMASLSAPLFGNPGKTCTIDKLSNEVICCDDPQQCFPLVSFSTDDHHPNISSFPKTFYFNTRTKSTIATSFPVYYYSMFSDRFKYVGNLIVLFGPGLNPVDFHAMIKGRNDIKVEQEDEDSQVTFYININQQWIEICEFSPFYAVENYAETAMENTDMYWEVGFKSTSKLELIPKTQAICVGFPSLKD